jgi:hypothetical protein
MSSILDFRGLYLCAAYLPANNLRRIFTIYLRGYWKGSENGRVVTIESMLNNYIELTTTEIFIATSILTALVTKLCTSVLWYQVK